MKDFPNMGADFSKVQLPMVYVARNCEFMSDVPGSEKANFPAKLYAADIKAARHGSESKVFEQVLFFEQNGSASIYGVENEDGLPIGLRPDLALKQQQFIEFLRAETQRKNEAIGLIAVIFEGHEYSQEQWATIAFITARGENINIGVGYKDTQSQKYTLIGIHHDDASDLFEHSRGLLSWDELG